MGLKIEVGSRVRFLDSVGGGIVLRIDRNGLIYVDDGSGFEVPMSKEEVVLVAPPQDKKTSVIANNIDTPIETSKPRVEESQRERQVKDEVADQTISAYLAIALEEESKAPGDSGYEVYLINDSNYNLTLLYLTGKDSHKELKYTGTIPFDTIDLLESFKPDRVPEHEHITVQVIAHRDDKAFIPKPVYSIDLRVEGARFFRQGAFIENPFFDFGVILLPLIENDKPFSPQKVDSDKLLSEILDNKKWADSKPHQAKRQHHGTTRKGEKVVVDLHINELVDTTVGMQPLDMLQIQLAKVKEVIEKYYAKPQYRGQVIIFIHGKGEGVLRKEIQRLLSQKYPKGEQQDASFQEYGFGATQVTLR